MESSKFSPNIKTNWIFIGTQSNTIWILLNRKTGAENRTADCAFKEHIFPSINQDVNSSNSLPIILNYKRIKKDSGLDQSEIRLRSSNDMKEVNIDLSLINEEPLDAREDRIIRSNPADSNKKSFRNNFALKLRALNAVNIEQNEDSISLDISTVLFESLTLEQAFSEDRSAWEASLLDGLRSLEINKTFEIIEDNYKAENNRKLISSRWALRNKLNADGSIARRKARIVGKGYEQQHGIDYFETFATVIQYATHVAILSYSAVHDLELKHLDVDTAFLNPTLNEPNFMKIPDYFNLLVPWIKGIENKFYLKLKKALYGLKQSPRIWFLEVKRFFKEICLKQGEADPNLFISSPMEEKAQRVFILLFVDNMLLSGQKSLIEEIKLKITNKWKYKNLGPVETFVEFQVKRNRENRSIFIHQEFYARKLLERLGMKNCNRVTTLLVTGTVLRGREDDNLLDADKAVLYR